ncbi:GlsB/YeaQ/YmgE family stress response membrane protein [Lentilactobacillus raoultii]|uniref:GlsB/YeaQ/YmgE family stress response membrane protein n=1 Tax=Lentilactobacillus raoultii TaxID=1987503 RepID=A0ABW3PE57_9LACO|nr:GlsB/YeaQ/YmgE family stress response membrane protein [Lentilactobacillus raoultii]
MLSLIWTLIIGGVIGVVAGAITSRDLPFGWIGNIAAGLIGAWLGEALLGSWGPQLAEIAIVPAIVGAVILVFLASLITRGLAD